METIFYVITIILFTGFLFQKLPVKKYRVSKKLSIIGLIGIMAAGQIIWDGNQTYPVANWSMYSSANPGLSYYEYTLVLENGERAHYPFSIISRTSPRALMTKLENLEISYARYISQNQDDEQLAQHPFEKMIISLLKIYLESHPEKQVKKFEVNGTLFSENDWSINPERYNYHTFHVE